MPELFVKEGSQESVVSMAEGSVTVGRAPENNIVLTDPAASGRHCMIQADGSKYKVIDLNSRNGTGVNGKRIDGSSEVTDGDAIGVGNAVMIFYVKGVPGVSRLTVKGPDEKESVFPLPSKTVGIGRLSSNEISIPHPGISNFHAQISFEDGKFRIQDLGSTNGTKVNGKFITSADLNDGDRIEMGPYSAVFQAAAGAGAAAGAAEDTGETGDEAEAVAAPEIVGRPRKPRPVMKPVVRPGGDKLIVAASILVGLGVLWVMIEAVVLRAPQGPTPQEEARLNLIIGNASFEDPMQDDGSVPYWQVRTDTHSVVKLTRDTGNFGTKSSLQVECMAGAPANAWALCVHAQDIPVDSGRAYVGSFWVRTRDRRGLSAAGMEWVNKGNRQILGEDFGQVCLEAGAWTKLSVTGIPPKGADRVRVFLSTYGGEKGSLWMDEVSLYEFPMDKVGTVRFEGPLGDCRLVTDRKGVVSLSTDELLLIRRCEVSVTTGTGEVRQSLGAVAKGYPTGGEEGGLAVRGKLYDFATSAWIKYEQKVLAEGGSARLEYRVWPEEGSLLSAIELFIFLPPDVMDERRLKMVSGGKTKVVDGPFVDNSVKSVSWSIGTLGVALDTSRFDKVTLKDGGRRGKLLILHERVSQTAPGTSADAAVVITPERVNAP